MFRIHLCLLATIVASAALAPVTLAGPIDDKLKTAMSAEIRDDSEVERDANRLPLQTLNFFGLQDDMRVIELLPGGGWYTKLLAPVLAEQGQLYVAIGTGRVSDGLLKQSGFDQVGVLDPGVGIERSDSGRGATIGAFTFDVEPVDMVLTFRNYHNFDKAGRDSINKAAYDALKPGGIYAVVDHTRRHMQDDDPENRRRVDPVLVIKEVQQAGFILEDYSNLHYRLDDELRYEVGRRSVSGNTDRFTLKFRKPE
ncbi:MAG: class I SAM-dependent methyltransferase [Wenzhouxiangellaceae bacterium]